MDPSETLFTHFGNQSRNRTLLDLIEGNFASRARCRNENAFGLCNLKLFFASVLFNVYNSIVLRDILLLASLFFCVQTSIVQFLFYVPEI